ncbi:hypothetical protein ACE38W_10435 [Chitinophaga sp. Hz27]|uniref:hypothetical protein n=1 Tax=Chitinophaga sp. Hz27 TaxID=3347169 RepID=UPI0035E2D3D2
MYSDKESLGRFFLRFMLEMMKTNPVIFFVSIISIVAVFFIVREEYKTFTANYIDKLD